MRVMIEVSWIDYHQGGGWSYVIRGDGNTKLIITHKDGKQTFRIENLEAK
jgi:hypothetical protein